LGKAMRNRKHQTGRGHRHQDYVAKLDHAKLSSKVSPVCITVYQIAKTIKSSRVAQGRRSNWRGCYVAGMPSIFVMAAGGASFRRDPQAQAKRHDRQRADTAEPEGDEPHQAPCQRSRVLLGGHQ
jgi:hypothetical protein